MSLQESKVPDDWKVADVVPIFKKGQRNMAANYRPVSLTSVVSKVMESILRDHMWSFLESNDALSHEQHGFTQGRSCLTNLMETVEKWVECIDEGDGVDVMYLDFRKAFDTVPHLRLLWKLEIVGLNMQLVNWIKAFLTDRRMRVIVNGKTSSWTKVLSGVPQGSVLGPLLFLVFVMDLPKVIRQKAMMFADDTKLWSRISEAADGIKLQEDLDNICKWLNDWQLQPNIDKYKVMHIHHDSSTRYELCDKGVKSVIKAVAEEKDLGILVTQDLKWARQCGEAAKKANKILGLIKRQFVALNPASFRILYKSFIRPHLEYCIQVWSPSLNRDINTLEKVQRRATKVEVRGIGRKSYEDRLRILNLTTLEQRRVRGDLIETFKILKGKVKVDAGVFFHLYQHAHGLRGHRMKLSVQRCKTNLKKFSFSN